MHRNKTRISNPQKNDIIRRAKFKNDIFSRRTDVKSYNFELERLVCEDYGFFGYSS